MNIVSSPLSREIRAVPPHNAELAFRVGLKALNRGCEAEALELLERARRLRPGDARLWQVTGLIHRKLDELEPAVAEFRQAARLAPRDPLIAHSLARVHLEAGLPASELFRAARSLAPRDGEVTLGLVSALVAEGRAEDALEELDRALTRDPAWIPGLSAMCKLRWELGDRAGFARGFDRALAAFPRDLTLWQSLLIILTQADLYDRALETIARGRAAAGEDVLFDANEAVCRTELGEAEAAERLFARLGHVADPTVRVREVRHRLRTGRYRDAAALAEQMAQGPAAFMFWPYLAAAWRLTGDSRWEWLEADDRFIGVFDLSGGIPSLPALAERLRGLHFAKAQPLEQSVRGGTQTDGNLLTRIDPEIRALRKVIVAAVEAYVAQLPPPLPGHPLLIRKRAPIRFAGSWSVRLNGEGFHSNHVHPVGWISSALYVSLPEGAMGGERQSGWLTFGELTELGLDLPPVRTVEPKPGRLVLFPSTMWHGTRPFAAGERLTVAFDVARPA